MYISPVLWRLPIRIDRTGDSSTGDQSPARFEWSLDNDNAVDRVSVLLTTEITIAKVYRRKVMSTVY